MTESATLLTDLEAGLASLFAEIQQHMLANPLTQAQADQLNGMINGFEKLFAILDKVEQQDQPEDNPLDVKSITEIGEYAFTLLQELQAWCTGTSLNFKDDTDQLALGFSLWVSGQGGKLFSLEPVVDAIAALANQTLEPQQLQNLFQNILQILDAVGDTIRQDLEKTNPYRPWRILNLNAGIIATRTHDPERMEVAFGYLLKNIPDDAPGFFAEGMEQMEKLDYPAHVRAVMNSYYEQLQGKKSLH